MTNPSPASRWRANPCFRCNTIPKPRPVRTIRVIFLIISSRTSAFPRAWKFPIHNKTSSTKIHDIMTQIARILAREILDSRGNPTIEVDVITRNGVMGRAAVPSGASTGQHEAVELRDNEPGRYLGKGVTRAVHNVNETLNKELNGMYIFAQELIDGAMIGIDETPNKS